EDQGDDGELGVAGVQVSGDGCADVGAWSLIDRLDARGERNDFPLADEAVIEHDGGDQEAGGGEDGAEHVRDALRASGEHEEEGGEECADVGEDIALEVGELDPVLAESLPQLAR